MNNEKIQFNFIKLISKIVKKNPDSIFIVSDNEEITISYYEVG